MGSEPSRDDDPTGVRALLSSLAQPEPMPDHLVERINASLAAAQTQRAAAMSSASAVPLVAVTRRRPMRILFATAGAAAAIALVTVVSSGIFGVDQPNTVSGSAVLSSTSSVREARTGAAPGTDDKATNRADTAAAPLVQIRSSGTRYTRAGFVTQAQTLHRATVAAQPLAPSGVGPAGTTAGLIDCLGAMGADGAQVVRADVALYEGRPAVIIVATTNGGATAYVVGLQCSPADVAVVRSATPLP